MANRRTRRGPAVVATLIALSAAGGLAYFAAREAADMIETQSRAEVREALRSGGYDWAEVAIDGLQVRLTGTAPDEIQRFRAKTRAETVVEPDRVIDEMQVAAREKLGSPNFEVELLRNDLGVSIVGLVPAGLDRSAMVAELRRKIGSGEISDLVETADYKAPDGWNDAFAFGLEAAQLARRAKVSISAEGVEVRAITDSAREKADLEAALGRARPLSVPLTLDVTAPRPVITPFTLRFVKDAEGARFDACAADNEASRDRIIAAGVKAGIAGEPRCTLGLGVPTSRWADAAVPAIAAIGTLGSGSVTISDTDITLFVPATVAPAAFDEAVGRLESALPSLFTLKAEHEEKADPDPGPAEFTAMVKGSGVELRGRITDARMRDAVESLARSRFGEVDNALRVDDAMPEGWTLRTIAAIDALATLDQGTVSVTPELIRLSGISGNQTASDMAAARLSQRLGAGARYELSIRYDRRLDPLLALPSGVECVDQLNAAMNESEIGFEPGKTVIAGDPEATLTRIAAIMQNCTDYRIELGGHTDSQGREDTNAELSRGRAQATLDAIRDHGVDVSHMSARGYGESQPIADNETEAGREANRRIEFTLLSEEPAVAPEISPAQKVSGVTDSPEVMAAKAAQAAARAASGVLVIALEGPDASETEGAEAQEVIAAATEPANAAANVDVAIQVIDALTLPALEIAFPDDHEGMSEGEAHGVGIPPEDLPELIPLGPPDVKAAVEAEAEAAGTETGTKAEAGE